MEFLSNGKSDLTLAPFEDLRSLAVLRKPTKTPSKDAKHSFGTCTSVILLAIFARATNWLNRNRMEQGCNFGSKDLWTLEQSPQIHSNPKFPWHCHLKIKQNDSLTHTLGPSLVLSVESESFQLMHFTAWRNRCKGDTQPGTHPFKGLSRLPPRFGRGDVLGMA